LRYYEQFAKVEQVLEKIEQEKKERVRSKL
jgi:hypothetical protein